MSLQPKKAKELLWLIRNLADDRNWSVEDCTCLDAKYYVWHGLDDPKKIAEELLFELEEFFSKEK